MTWRGPGRMHERHYVVAVDGTRVKYECPRGHYYTIDHGQGPVARRLSAWWCGRMLTYWGRANGGVAVGRPCPWCARA